MNLFQVLGAFSWFLLLFQTEIVHGKSILGVAISTRADKISLDSTSTNNTNPETKASSDTIIRKGSKQDDDDGASSQGTNVGTPIQTVVNSILVPGGEYIAASILKAVSSPFEFLTKSVSDYVNPTTSTEKPAKKVVSENNPVVVASGQHRPQSQNQQVTYLVISPDQPPAVPLPASSQKVASPAPVAPEKTTASREEDEEDDEEIEDGFFN